MTRSEYQDLVEFLGKKFGALEGRLKKVEVTVDENRHLIQLVAENVTGLREKMDREFLAVRQEMADGFQLQGNAIRSLGARMDRWEGLSA